MQRPQTSRLGALSRGRAASSRVGPPRGFRATSGWTSTTRIAALRPRCDLRPDMRVQPRPPALIAGLPRPREVNIGDPTSGASSTTRIGWA